MGEVGVVVLVSVLLAVGVLLPAYAVARAAERRGYNGRVFFVAAMISWPALLIVIAFLPPRPPNT